jgi:hypothetical protein
MAFYISDSISTLKADISKKTSVAGVRCDEIWKLSSIDYLHRLSTALRNKDVSVCD